MAEAHSLKHVVFEPFDVDLHEVRDAMFLGEDVERDHRHAAQLQAARNAAIGCSLAEYRGKALGGGREHVVATDPKVDLAAGIPTDRRGHDDGVRRSGSDLVDERLIGLHSHDTCAALCKHLRIGPAVSADIEHEITLGGEFAEQSEHLLPAGGSRRPQHAVVEISQRAITRRPTKPIR